MHTAVLYTRAPGRSCVCLCVAVLLQRNTALQTNAASLWAIPPKKWPKTRGIRSGTQTYPFVSWALSAAWRRKNYSQTFSAGAFVSPPIEDDWYYDNDIDTIDTTIDLVWSNVAKGRPMQYPAFTDEYGMVCWLPREPRTPPRNTSSPPSPFKNTMHEDDHISQQ